MNSIFKGKHIVHPKSIMDSMDKGLKEFLGTKDYEELRGIKPEIKWETIFETPFIHGFLPNGAHITLGKDSFIVDSMELVINAHDHSNQYVVYYTNKIISEV